jgi:hypothetical protein
VNPGIATEFSTAAFRLGHSMLGEDIQFLDNDGNPVRDEVRLKDVFFDPRSVSEVGIDPLLKYLASDRAQEIDTKVVDDVRNFLFGAPGQGGFDLVSLNIQRGRDHGLADYNTVRVAYGLPKVTSFAQITSDTAVQASLQQAYGSVDKLDLWVAGLAEKHLPGSSLGETFTRIMVDQFSRLRDGVRQSKEGGVAGTTVTLVTMAGATVATTRSDARGDYSFRGIDLGSFRVVVTPPTGAGQAGEGVKSRVVAITRGMDVRDVNVGLPPKPATPPTKQQPAPQPPARSPLAAAFAGIAASQPRPSLTLKPR